MSLKRFDALWWGTFGKFGIRWDDGTQSHCLFESVAGDWTSGATEKEVGIDRTWKRALQRAIDVLYWRYVFLRENPTCVKEAGEFLAMLSAEQRPEPSLVDTKFQEFVKRWNLPPALVSGPLLKRKLFHEGPGATLLGENPLFLHTLPACPATYGGRRSDGAEVYLWADLYFGQVAVCRYVRRLLIEKQRIWPEAMEAVGQEASEEKPKIARLIWRRDSCMALALNLAYAPGKIVDELRLFLSPARPGMQPRRKGFGRFRYGREELRLYPRYYKVWTLHRHERLAFREIAARLYPRLAPHKAANRAKRQFYRAFELVTGIRFEKDAYAFLLEGRSPYPEDYLRGI